MTNISIHADSGGYVRVELLLLQSKLVNVLTNRNILILKQQVNTYYYVLAKQFRHLAYCESGKQKDELHWPTSNLVASDCRGAGHVLA